MDRTDPSMHGDLDTLPPPLSAQLLPGVPLVESPLFAASIDAMGLSASERDIALQLHTRGYAVLDFPDPLIDARMERIKAAFSPQFGIDPQDPETISSKGDMRVQDAWQHDDDVKAIATNEAILALLSKLYGRRAFPFQTLNFPVGTQQAYHTDSVHFSSQPERFMCGVWLAMEDIAAGAGPLIYYPGSHKWPVLSNAMIGRLGSFGGPDLVQQPFQSVWDAMVEASGIAPETFLARKGQALIWTANLLHGGSGRQDLTMTRWSQVTHYFFADCIYYTPARSDEALGKLDLRSVINVATGQIEPNRLMGQILERPVSPAKTLIGRVRRRLKGKREAG